MRKLHQILGLLIVFVSCVEPYDFEVTETEDRAIVVDASLTNEQRAHFARISYSYALDRTTDNPVRAANVWIEDNDSIKTLMDETKPGYYTTDSTFAGEIGKSYTLHIVTADGEVFKSSEETLIAPSPIDSVYGKYLKLPSSESGSFKNGVQFYIDSHSENISSFRYDYIETYEIRVPFPSPMIWSYEKSTYAPRDIPVEVCYITKKSNSLIQSTTQGLSSNRISEFPIRFVNQTEPLLMYKYSISIRQYAISSASYSFYKDVKENNESAGSFFDKQKGAILGNIQSVENPETPILGFFEVSGVSEIKKVFTPDEFLKDGFEIPERQFCKSYEFANVDTIPLFTVGDYLLREDMDVIGRLMRIYGLISGNTGGDQAIMITQSCSDCTIYGDLYKPEFWD